MTRGEVLYLIPYFASLALSIGILAYAWSRKSAQGATAFAYYAMGQALWIVGFIFELISAGIANKIYWNGFQWLAAVLTTLALPAFVIQYTETKLKYARVLFRLSFIIPGAFAFLVLSDSYFHWIYSNPRIIPATPFPELMYDFTLPVYGFAVYAYLLAACGVYILTRHILHPHRLYRAQAIVITLGILIPILGSIFALLGVHITPQRDPIPFTAAMGNLIIAWGLLRFRIFEVAPIGRDKVFEAMVEPVVIVDKKNRIADINSAMLALLGKTANEVVGESAKIIFDDFPIPIKQYLQTSYARTDAQFEMGGLHIHYELTVWPLYNARKEITGRIYISHDITAMKQLESELRKLNLELENRVRLRTWELATAYDSTIEGWARTLELRDKETEGHSRRVTDMTMKIAMAMGIRDDYLEHIRRGAMLHDIGKMAIPDEILHKPESLSNEEREIVKTHPQIAYDLLSPIPFLDKALEIPYSHHEKWDGTGYPQGLKGHAIPMSARIFAIADVWDALASERPYNGAWSRENAVKFFIEQAGKHFDPRVVNVFLNLVDKGEI